MSNSKQTKKILIDKIATIDAKNFDDLIQSKQKVSATVANLTVSGYVNADRELRII